MSLFCSSAGVISIAKVGVTNDAITRAQVVTYVDGLATGNPADIFSDGWDHLPHCISADLTPNTETPNKIRTSDTNGARVSPGCAALTEYELTATNALDATDWLWCYLLSTPTNPQTGRTAWMRIRPFGKTDDTAQIFVKVSVNPGGYGFDNDSSDAATTEWSAEVLEAPVYPACGTDKNVQNTT